MTALGSKRALAFVSALCGSWCLLLAPSAQAATVNVNALARVVYIGSNAGAVQFAGTVTDPAVGNGGLLATVRPTAGGFRGSALFVNPSGSMTGTFRVTVRVQGPLVRLGFIGAVTGATGRFAGARGTLTGSALVTATLAKGNLRLHGTLHGAVGRAPTPLPSALVRHVDGRFQGAELSVAPSGLETIVGSATGIVPGPAVVVVHDRATRTSVRGTFTVFVAGGSVSGVIGVRLRGSGAVRSESGTATITGGVGDLTGARSTSSAAVSGTRNLVTQLIALTIRGAFTP